MVERYDNCEWVSEEEDEVQVKYHGYREGVGSLVCLCVALWAVVPAGLSVLFWNFFLSTNSSMLSQHSFISGLNFFPIFGTFGTHIFKIPFPIIKRSFSFSIHMLFVMHLNKYLGERSPNAFFNVSKFEFLVFTVTNPLWFNVWARTLPLNCI